jgi:small subunit ribosomal protein S11
MAASKQTSRASNKARKSKRVVSKGIAHVKASFNNTVVTLTDTNGNKLCQSSAGACGFRGARKSTPFAAQAAAQEVCNKAVEMFKMESITVHIDGAGPGRDSAVRGFRNAETASKSDDSEDDDGGNSGRSGRGISVVEIIDKTRYPHNGCRPPKKRRC